jgi:small neutral amino acid transporter SnatA (MarC family)
MVDDSNLAAMPRPSADAIAVKPDSARRRFELCFRALLALFTIGFLGWLLFEPNGETGLTWFSDITLSTTAIAGGILALIVGSRMKGPDRRSWLFIGAGILSWGV